jgi:serine/threonine protein kinase
MNEREIFISALEKAPSERQAYLDQACGADLNLRRHIQALFEVDAHAGSFLESPPAGILATIGAQDCTLLNRTIGPYRILEQIGEGGMGLVFMAEQTQPVRRKVALKVVKPGMDTRQVVARFEAERQALAIMDHPHIAKVFDAGVTESGRPYFVMELVRGVPITTYCDERRLTTRQRLELFVLVCQAVQHAHRKGVIHRDFKPSNILVTQHDTVAVPKIIDFGIAKATSQPLTELTLFTHFTQMLGTPLYMSPEQAEMNGLDVDTRSDVYSLGVMLYELLTGTTPFESETLKKVGLDEMRRMIREDEPPTPSRRFSTMSAQACSTISERRGVDGRRLVQVIRGELDWIVMKALEKDRERRYESASALVADLQRYLDDEPVEACAPTTGYRLQKYVRRNRRTLATVGIIALALVTATAVSTWQAVIARDAQHQAEGDRDRAEAAESRATTEAAIARAVNRFLQEDMLKNDSPDGYNWKRNPDLTAREALNRASVKVAERFRDQPLVEAAIRTAIGEAYDMLDYHLPEVEHFERALQLRRAHLGPDHPDTLQSMKQLAGAYAWVGRASESITLYDELLTNARARLGPDDPLTLDLVCHLSIAWRRAGHWQRAMRLLEPVVEKDAALRGPAADRASGAAHVLGMLYMDAGKPLEAAARLEKVLAVREATRGPDDPDTLYALKTCAAAYQMAGKLDEADHLYRCALERERKRKDSTAQIGVAHTLVWLSSNSLLRERYKEAELQVREATSIYEKNEKTRPDSDDWVPSYLMSLLGGALLGQKKYADAEPLLLNGYEGVKQREATLPAPFRHRLTETGERVIRYYEETNQPEKAREWRRKLGNDSKK